MSDIEELKKAVEGLQRRVEVLENGQPLRQYPTFQHHTGCMCPADAIFHCQSPTCPRKGYNYEVR